MNIQDLAVLLAAVELAVKRGTYSILEIGAVGEAAGKLNAFLSEAQRQAQEAAAPAEGEAAAEAQPEQPAQ